MGVTKPWLLLTGFSTSFWEKSHKDCTPWVCLLKKCSPCQSFTQRGAGKLNQSVCSTWGFSGRMDQGRAASLAWIQVMKALPSVSFSCWSLKGKLPSTTVLCVIVRNPSAPQGPRFSGCGLNSHHLCRILTFCCGCKWELPGRGVSSTNQGRALLLLSMQRFSSVKYDQGD